MKAKAMKLEVDDISAEVYRKTDKGIYLVKVSLPSLGMYINSITVRASTKYPDKGLWVQMPTVKVGARWFRTIEFRNDSEFKQLIEDAVLRAVDAFNHDEVVIDPDDIDISGAIDETLNKPP